MYTQLYHTSQKNARFQYVRKLRQNVRADANQKYIYIFCVYYIYINKYMNFYELSRQAFELQRTRDIFQSSSVHNILCRWRSACSSQPAQPPTEPVADFSICTGVAIPLNP